MQRKSALTNACLVLGSSAAPDRARRTEIGAARPQNELEVYGFAMLDGGFDFGSIGDPNC